MHDEKFDSALLEPASRSAALIWSFLALLRTGVEGCYSLALGESYSWWLPLLSYTIRQFLVDFLIGAVIIRAHQDRPRRLWVVFLSIHFVDWVNMGVLATLDDGLPAFVTQTSVLIYAAVIVIGTPTAVFWDSLTVLDCCLGLLPLADRSTATQENDVQSQGSKTVLPGRSSVWVAGVALTTINVVVLKFAVITLRSKVINSMIIMALTTMILCVMYPILVMGFGSLDRALYRRGQQDICVQHEIPHRCVRHSRRDR